MVDLSVECFEFCRVACGTCITNLTISKSSELQADNYSVEFSRPLSQATCTLSVGDMVVISEVNSKAVIVTTTRVSEINANSLTLLLDR